MRKGFGQLVDTAKGLQTRKVRAEKVAETVMLAMEGEQEPPPILRAAFQRQPLARTGWDAMTPTQRRSHLLGIFFRDGRGTSKAGGKGGGRMSARGATKKDAF